MPIPQTSDLSVIPELDFTGTGLGSEMLSGDATRMSHSASAPNLAATAFSVRAALEEGTSRLLEDWQSGL